MRIRYHEGIFYPKEKEEIDKLLYPIEKKEAASSLIVPHASLKIVSPLLRSAFSHFGEPEKVVILSPLHSGREESDRCFSFFEGEENREEKITRLGAGVNESYAEEEAGAEILLPFIHSLSPSTNVSIIYTDIRKADESRALSSFLKEHTNTDTLFIISTNLSPLCSTIEECDEWRRRAVTSLLEEKNILDEWHNNRVRICARGAVDSINRIVRGPWIEEKEGEGETTAHGVLWKRK